ncbi:MAG TPA: alpha/beta hydrolase [Bacteroidales bacterium]|nr:alpha/beta hydrolase [Bacteroidales bacterium]
MKFIFSVICCLLIVLSADAQHVYKIWEGTQVTYQKLDNPDLTAFTNTTPENTHVAVIICPGGSYHHLGVNTEGYDVANWFQSRGINAFVLRYRVGFFGYHHPAMIEDLQRSIQFIKENAAKWDIDTSKVGLIGFSAGGHLVASGGTLYNENFLLPLGIIPRVSLRPNFVVPVYPVISMQDSIAHKRSRKNLLGPHFTKELMDEMSLERQVRHGDPPMMIVVAKDDPVVDWRNSYYFYRSLKDAGVACKLLLNEKGGHGFGIDPKKGGKAALWNVECIKWLHEIGVLSDYITSLK